jgi:hypothetical protein
MLEEVGVAYELRPVDIMKGAQKAPELLALNPMGKLPILTDGDAVVTESAAIALYLADGRMGIVRRHAEGNGVGYRRSGLRVGRQLLDGRRRLWWHVALHAGLPRP